MCIATTLVSSFAVIYAFYVFASDTGFYENSSCVNISQMRFCYFGKDGVWSDSSYLQAITGFYSTVITVLIGIIAIVATVGAYTIKASIRAQIEQELPHVVSNHFKHVDGQNGVRAVVEEKMENKLNRLELPERGALRETILSLERRLEALEESYNAEGGEL